MASKNPVEEYLTEKTAGFGASLYGGAKGVAQDAFKPEHLGSSAMRGLIGTGMAAAGAGTVALGIHGGQKLYDAATKARDFRAMLQADPRIAQMHEENPQRVNQMFSTLRTFNPQFTRDPIVASSYVHKMVEDPMHAGGVAVEALNFRDKMKNPLTDNVTRVAFHSAEKSHGSDKKPKP